MYTTCCSTPYCLNFKLKTLSKYPSNYTKNADINSLYNNLNNSIPAITNHLCLLKKRTKELNKSLNRIPIIYNNNNNTVISKRANYTFYSPNCIKTSPNSSNYYNSVYISPKPVLKQYKYICDNNNHNNHQKNVFNYKKNRNYDNNQIKLNYNYNCGSNANNNPIKITKNINPNIHHNRTYSAFNMNRNNYKFRNNYNNMNNGNNDVNKLCVSCYDRKDNFNNNGDNNYMNKSSVIDTRIYERQLNKLNEEIYEKDKMINKMQGLIDNTFEQLNQKNKENSLLQSELLELKKKRKIKKDNPNDNNRYYNNNNYMKDINKNKNKNRRKQNNFNFQKFNNNNNMNNNNKNYNNRYNYYNDKNDDEDMDKKWEEIRKLNKKMDNLLQQNESNLEKYEKIRRKYNNGH